MQELERLNPWWKDKRVIESDFHIKRIKDSSISWHPNVIPKLEEGIYSIRGPRQIGKTTWIKLTIKDLLKKIPVEDIMYFNCDILNSKEDIISLIREYFELFEKRGRKYIFLDEISYVKDWQLAIKHIYDSGELQNIVLVITGSYSIDIKKAFEKLPGRIGFGKRHYKLLPLTFKEYLQATGSSLLKKKNLHIYITELNKEFTNYLLTGGFPAVIDYYKKNKMIDETFYEIYKNWVIGDLEKWGRSEKHSKQIFKRMFEVYTTVVNWDSLSSGTDIKSHTTIRDYVLTFEDIFAAVLINRMDYNKKVPDYPKSKKIYFSDPFVYYSIWKWCYAEEKCFEYFREQMRNPLFQSKIIEGVVLNHIVKYLEEKTTLDKFDYKDQIFYWVNRTKSVEVDFVLKKDLKALEVKWSNKLRDKQFKAKKYFRNFLLLTKNKEGKFTKPVSLFLLDL